MFCPECKAEYRPGFLRCNGCDVELVDRLPAPDPVKSEEVPEVVYSDYVVVSTVQGQFEEVQVCSFLRANGVPARIRGEAIRKTYGITMDGIGAAKILVPRELEPAARDLLAKVDRGELEIEDSPDGDGETNEEDDADSM